MNHTTLDRSPEEAADIERHKYFLSEKAGHDVGWEAAEQDWLAHHAKQFRQATDAEAEATPAKGLSIFFKRFLPKRSK